MDFHRHSNSNQQILIDAKFIDMLYCRMTRKQSRGLCRSQRHRSSLANPRAIVAHARLTAAPPNPSEIHAFIDTFFPPPLRVRLPQPVYSHHCPKWSTIFLANFRPQLPVVSISSPHISVKSFSFKHYQTTPGGRGTPLPSVQPKFSLKVSRLHSLRSADAHA
jgi:hypothetical protein